MVYYCKDCNAYVGCHNNTRVSKGTMANAELRAKRIMVHNLIDPLWQSGNRGRREVYKMLSDAFGEQIHVGESDLKRCDEIIKTAKQIFPELMEAQ